MVNKVAPFTPAAQGFGAVAAATLAADGFDVVRLGVLYQAVEPEPGVINHNYLRAVARTVTELSARGVYTLLDFHQDEMNQEFGGEGFPSGRSRPTASQSRSTSSRWGTWTARH